MNLASLDWLIVALMFGGIALVAVAMRRHTRTVADFLAGNRCAGRYLLTLSEGVGNMGLVGTVAAFEQFYKSGFAGSWWGTILGPVALVVALSGWVGYRYRETRALTMAQFFEMRYSRRFRIFAGIVAWGSGVLNFGVFPGIVGRTLIYFCGFPPTLAFGGLHVPTLVPVMAFMIGVTLVLVLTGGLVTAMITDFIQSQFINIVFVIVAVALFAKFRWPDIVGTLEQVPTGKSLINPFDQGGISDFNFWFFFVIAFKLVYNRLGWQGTQGFNSAAKSPHEARMAGVLAEWRNGVGYLMLTLMPICAYVFLHHPGFAGEAASVHAALEGISDGQIREQMTAPLSLVRMLPAGVLGLLAAAMIAGTIGSDTSYLHSWGSIFIQDVVLPFRKAPLTPRQHLRYLRLSICGVAAFCFVFSLLFPLHDYIQMYFLVTGAIYLGGSGAVIIGGLYWKRGTTQGAWCGMITGAGLALVGAAARSVWPMVPFLVRISPEFPLNGAWVALITSLAAIVAYVVVSLATCRRPFDMDRLLHRGRYTVAGEHSRTDRPRHWRLLGISGEFTRGDRIIYFSKIAWTLLWFTAFVVGTIAGLTVGISGKLWADWWLFQVILGLAVGTLTVIWFLWGGMRDLLDLVRNLGQEKPDADDDGTVPGSSKEASPASMVEVRR